MDEGNRPSKRCRQDSREVGARVGAIGMGLLREVVERDFAASGRVPLSVKRPSQEGSLSIIHVGDSTPGLMRSWMDLCAALAAAKVLSM